jgi:outer membrane receptor protein involved in Fe transport
MLSSQVAKKILCQFNIARPTNRFGGTLEGYELAIQHLFDNGFGFIANFTFVDGDTDADPSYIGEQFALGGFGDAGNFAVFYENEKVSTRLSYNWKGETYAGMDQYNPLYIEERGQVDFTASYNLNDKGAVFFEAINVTNEDVRLFSRFDDMLFLYQDHGQIYKAGFRYKF